MNMMLRTLKAVKSSKLDTDVTCNLKKRFVRIALDEFFSPAYFFNKSCHSKKKINK